MAPRIKPMDMRTTKPPPKVGEADTKSAAHEAWRKAVLDRAGWRCQTCGKQGGRGGAMLYADHIVERRDGGSLTDVSNGKALCGSCHTKKTGAERMRRFSEGAEDDGNQTDGGDA